MLALLVAVTLGQCTTDMECKGDRVCVDGRCMGSALVPHRAPDLRVEQLEAERPRLHWSIASLAAGLIALAAGAIITALTSDGTGLLTGLVIGGTFLFSGGISLGTTLWARHQVSQMIDELER